MGGIELQGYATDYIDPIPHHDDLFDGGVCLTTYTTQDIDKIFSVVKKSEHAQILSPITTLSSSPYSGGRAFNFKGPSGERVEITENDWRP